MTTVAGVDVSTKAVHAAIVADKQLLFVRQYDLGDYPLGPIQAMLRDLQKRGVERIYSEQPFFVPARLDKDNPGKIRQGSNVNTLKLHKISNAVETLAMVAGVPLTFVATATWKSTILTGVPGDTTKARSLWFVRRVWNLQTDDDNKADAICLATYGEAMLRFRGRIPPAIEVT